MLSKYDIDFIVIHCTDSKRDFTEFAQVNLWHKERNWHSEKSGVNIGYHWFINGKGQLTQGRRRYGNYVEMGAQAFGLNEKSIGICLALKKGEIPSPAQLSNLKTLLRKEMKEYRIRTEERDNKGNLIGGVIGHRDVAKIKKNPSLATECPTDALYNALQKIKEELKKEGY